MDNLFNIDWQSIWQPGSSVLEMVIRGTVTYWAIFVLLRFFRRGAGQLGVSDVLLIILIGDAAQNAMAGEYKSITEGIVLIGTLVFWDYTIDWLGYRSVWFNKFTQASPTPLILNGTLLKDNLKKELITVDDLLSILREQGVDDFRRVRSCHLEGSGNISVVQETEFRIPQRGAKSGNQDG
ncbi:DUF421 domain-containing protein [Dyadobacter chenwenxiniae]|uniref:DUF421 domain-containing protein n=1 Tax=Dyadobacter chenwenxiniae TaxID=2906456 RepID=A0A9X1TI79_9BACT|nr:YetF domain-containing protein [Dyadobacter chenwenxiniae]MCF0050512.1 DUF421 domain-containing protein [Dyadobacter chenwenxiniae]MCF0065244.1 DUF421 domain-containing protein [Dyadobacter chenwenxiniae]UON84486.1 DUF421 domain-containing protein [Dyadobacter chenwenxiniae]